MQPQHLRQHVFAHRRDHMRVDEAHDRHPARQRGIVEQMVDPGAERDDELEVGQRREQPVRRLPHHGDLDLGGVADLGMDAEIEIGQVAPELLLPALRIA